MDRGFTIVQAMLIVVGVALFGAGIWFVAGVGQVRDVGTQSNGSENRAQEAAEEEASSGLNQNAASDDDVTWDFNGKKWEADGTPPNCPEPLELKSPVDLGLATSILYPGQTRSGDYKPHGGFGFADGTNADVAVTTSLDAQLTRASRYIQEGETQYLFDFINSCGIAYRFDHLLTLTPKFQAIADSLPAAKVDDSRMTPVSPAVAILAGETVATAVGFPRSGSTQLDFGVYDLRQTNAASKDPAWAAQNADDREQAPYAVCWFDLLAAADQARVRSLPPEDSQNGSTSDYCK